MKERNSVMWLTSGTREKERSEGQNGDFKLEKERSKADEKFRDET